MSPSPFPSPTRGERILEGRGKVEVFFDLHPEEGGAAQHFSL